ncbi:hypothetical protein CO611_00235 [Lysobacteraceae bacterium NML03-0222]|nr:hypothetical protein CO611_00235 [Xanthomonadaceae bacterium NML03-0222]
MVEKEIEIDSFDVKYSLWASIFAVFILFPIALSILKLLDVKNAVGQTQLIIFLLSMVFGFLIAVMKITVRKVCFMRRGNDLFIKDGKNIEFKLGDVFNYNLYDYNSRKAFMVRVSSRGKSYFYLSPNMNLKGEVEYFFGKSNMDRRSVDFFAKAFPLALCFAYFSISIAFFV